MKHIDNPALEIRDLRVALALAAAGTTARAAALLHLTQPAVSRALTALEGKLGARLFERSSRGLCPTAAGERLLVRAGALLADLGELERRVREPAEEPIALRLVCECYTAYHWLPSTLETLRKVLPTLELSLAIEHTRAPAEALEAGKIDVALLTVSDVSHPSLEERPLFTDEIVFLVAPDHPLAAKKALTRADLEMFPLITAPAPAKEVAWFVRSVFGRKKPRLRYERLPLTEAIIDVTRAGLGVAVLSEWIATPHLERGGLVKKRLNAGALERPWRLVYRRDVRAGALRLHSALTATGPRSRAP